MNEQNRCRWLVPQPRRMCGRWAFFLLKLLRRGGGNGRWVELTLLFPAVCFWRNGIRTLSEFDPEPLLLDLSDGLSLLSLSLCSVAILFYFASLFLLLFSSVLSCSFSPVGRNRRQFGRRQQLPLLSPIDSTTSERNRFSLT